MAMYGEALEELVQQLMSDMKSYCQGSEILTTRVRKSYFSFGREIVHYLYCRLGNPIPMLFMFLTMPAEDSYFMYL